MYLRPDPVLNSTTRSVGLRKPEAISLSYATSVAAPSGAAKIPSFEAIADTAERAQTRPDEVVIAAWSPVTWNDGSLGCPAKGMSYTQATVPGELLMLRVDSALFQYHARTGGPFAYCANPSAGWSVGG